MNTFSIRYNTFDPKHENYRESIFTLSNTVMGMRGIEDEGTDTSWPGLYIAGLFNQSECIAPEIVNFPDMLPVWLEAAGLKISSDTCAVKSYKRDLDMRQGVLARRVVFETARGDCTVESRRFLSFADKHCGAIEYTFTFAGYSGPVSLKTSFDACQPSREGSYQYDETVKHYHLMAFNDQYEKNFYSRVRLRDRGTLVDFASFTHISVPVKQRSRKIFYEKAVETVEIDVVAGEPCTAVKYFVIDDSRGTEAGTLKERVLSKLEYMKRAGFEAELARSAFELSRLWKNADVVLEGDDEMQRMLRFNIFQLLGLGAEHSSAFAIGAKGLSTEHYGGTYFWDTEIYLLPYYLNTNPAVARNLLAFRARTLDAACQRAREQGFSGCLWPWQSDELGNEGIRQTVTPEGVILRRAILDQYHIVSDIAYACFRYYHQTGDEAFLWSELMPVIVESMRFWKSFILKQNDPAAGEYHIRNVMGPDEYHTDVDDNYYTNFLTKYLFKEFFHCLEDAAPKQRHDMKMSTGLTDAELETFRTISERIHLPAMKNNVIEQFDGYFDREDLPLTEFNDLGMPAYPDPSVGAGLPDAERQDALQAHATGTQLIKQADAILPLCLLPEKFSSEQIRATFEYYDKRTLQYSSLSPGVCAIAGAKAGAVDRAYQLFKLGAAMDLRDVKHETETGLHTACHGGTYLGVVAGFAGVEATADCLNIHPQLPDHWTRVAFNVYYRGVRLSIECSHAGAGVSVSGRGSARVRINGEIREVSSDDD